MKPKTAVGLYVISKLVELVVYFLYTFKIEGQRETLSSSSDMIFRYQSVDVSHAGRRKSSVNDWNFDRSSPFALTCFLF